MIVVVEDMFCLNVFSGFENNNCINIKMFPAENGNLFLN